MTTRIGTILTVGMFLLSISSQAQNAIPPGGPPNPGNLAQAAKGILNLTDQQVQQLTDLRNSFQTTTQNLRTNLRNLQQQIYLLVNSSNPDATQLANLIAQRQTLEQQLKTAAESYQTSAQNLLTQAQKDKLSQIQEALKLAAQARPLAALGLIQGPGPGGGSFSPRGFGRGPGFGPLRRRGPASSQGTQTNEPQQRL